MQQGGRAAYMAVMSLANSLMLDFRCLIIPRFVYAQSDAFNGSKICNQAIVKRIDELAIDAIRLNGVNIKTSLKLV